MLPLIGGKFCSVAPGSSEPGASVEPILAGPFGAPTPARKRRYPATTLAACGGVAAPASSAHDCGSLEDRSDADLAQTGVAAGEPASRHVLALDDVEVARRGDSQLRREGVISEHVGDLRDTRVYVGGLRRDEVRLGHLQELGSEVAPVSGRAGQILAVRTTPDHVLLVIEGELQVVPQRPGPRLRVGDLGL